jgi:hypothetical protein
MTKFYQNFTKSGHTDFKRERVPDFGTKAVIG